MTPPTSYRAAAQLLGALAVALLIVSGITGSVATEALDQARAARARADDTQRAVDDLRHEMRLHHPRFGPEPVYVRHGTSASAVRP